MRRTAVLAAMIATFVLGVGVARLVPGAVAADAAAPMPRVVNLVRMSDEAIGPERPGTHIRSNLLVASLGATVSVQTGDVAKHFHQDSDEIQYIIEGQGTFWLGDRQIEVGPGDLIVIPKGTPHAGSHATTGRFKAIAIKTPPQASDDLHPVN
jgi:mannose-6-phosphate isomerase-like protein (cupin superfamily)